MTNTYRIKVGFTKLQVEKIRKDSEKNGFKTISQYIRWFIINKSTETEEKVYLIYEMLKNGR